MLIGPLMGAAPSNSRLPRDTGVTGYPPPLGQRRLKRRRLRPRHHPQHHAAAAAAAAAAAVAAAAAAPPSPSAGSTEPQRPLLHPPLTSVRASVVGAPAAGLALLAGTHAYDMRSHHTWSRPGGLSGRSRGGRLRRQRDARCRQHDGCGTWCSFRHWQPGQLAIIQNAREQLAAPFLQLHCTYAPAVPQSTAHRPWAPREVAGDQAALALLPSGVLWPADPPGIPKRITPGAPGGSGAFLVAFAPGHTSPSANRAYTAPGRVPRPPSRP